MLQFESLGTALSGTADRKHLPVPVNKNIQVQESVSSVYSSEICLPIVHHLQKSYPEITNSYNFK